MICKLEREEECAEDPCWGGGICPPHLNKTTQQIYSGKLTSWILIGCPEQSRCSFRSCDQT